MAYPWTQDSYQIWEHQCIDHTIPVNTNALTTPYYATPVFRNKPGKWSTKPLLLHMHLIKVTRQRPLCQEFPMLIQAYACLVNGLQTDVQGCRRAVQHVRPLESRYLWGSAGSRFASLALDKLRCAAACPLHSLLISAMCQAVNKDRGAGQPMDAAREMIQPLWQCC
eukprot:4511001-Amphidinium_carterae.2